MKTKRDTGLGLIFIDDIIGNHLYAESNGHVTDDVTQLYDVTVVRKYSMHITSPIRLST